MFKKYTCAWIITLLIFSSYTIFCDHQFLMCSNTLSIIIKCIFLKEMCISQNIFLLLPWHQNTLNKKCCSVHETFFEKKFNTTRKWKICRKRVSGRDLQKSSLQFFFNSWAPIYFPQDFAWSACMTGLVFPCTAPAHISRLQPSVNFSILSSSKGNCKIPIYFCITRVIKWNEGKIFYSLIVLQLFLLKTLLKTSFGITPKLTFCITPKLTVWITPNRTLWITQIVPSEFSLINIPSGSIFMSLQGRAPSGVRGHENTAPGCLRPPTDDELLRGAPTTNLWGGVLSALIANDVRA